MSITIRPIETHAEYHALEQLQRDVWTLPDVEVVPLHVLLTAAKNGGCCSARLTARVWLALSSASPG